MADAVAYATVDQLAALLKPRGGRATREEDLIRVLQQAAKEIDSEIGGGLGWSDDAQALSLLESVNLRRAADIWEFEQVQAGIIGFGTESPIFVPRNSWERYAQELAVLKQEWGVA